MAVGKYMYIIMQFSFIHTFDQPLDIHLFGPLVLDYVLELQYRLNFNGTTDMHTTMSCYNAACFPNL